MVLLKVCSYLDGFVEGLFVLGAGEHAADTEVSRVFGRQKVQQRQQKEGRGGGYHGPTTPLSHDCSQTSLKTNQITYGRHTGAQKLIEKNVASCKMRGVS